MRIVVFGGSGGTGGAVVRQACEAGHEVTAVVRDPAKLEWQHALLTVVRADVMNPAAVRPHLGGCDAVVTAIGARSVREPTTVQTDSTTSLIEAMTGAGVRRFVAVSNSGMITEGDGPLIKLLLKPVLRRVFAHPWADQARMEEVVRGSDREWTLIRPPRLTDGPRTGTYRTAVGRNVRGGARVSRADVADCILRSLADPGTVGEAISLAD